MYTDEDFLLIQHLNTAVGDSPATEPQFSAPNLDLFANSQFFEFDMPGAIDPNGLPFDLDVSKLEPDSKHLFNYTPLSMILISPTK